MKGYPNHVATKQDFLNLLEIDELKDQALADLQSIHDLKDDKAMKTISIDKKTGEAETEEIDNPMPMWKRKGFKNRKEIAGLIKKYGGKK